jgi:hypothetical protein
MSYIIYRFNVLAVAVMTRPLASNPGQVEGSGQVKCWGHETEEDLKRAT